MHTSLQSNRRLNQNVIIFWVIVTLANLVIGISIAVIGVMQSNHIQPEPPEFVTIAEQANLIHRQLQEGVDTNTTAINNLTKRTDEIDQRVIILEKQ